MPEVITLKLKDNAQKAFQNDTESSLADYMDAVRDFEEEFCRLMFSRKNFTLRLEVHGVNGIMKHARVNVDKLRKPRDSDKRIAKSLD